MSYSFISKIIFKNDCCRNILLKKRKKKRNVLIVRTTFKMNSRRQFDETCWFEVFLSLSCNCFSEKVEFVFSNHLNMYFESRKTYISSKAIRGVYTEY